MVESFSLDTIIVKYRIIRSSQLDILSGNSQAGYLVWDESTNEFYIETIFFNDRNEIVRSSANEGDYFYNKDLQNTIKQFKKEVKNELNV